MAESSNTGPPRDFSFILRPAIVLKKAVDALSDPTFNPKQQAMIQVGENGFDITVECIDKETNNQIFGYLGLNATALEEFQSNMPFRKMVSLKLINKLFKDVSNDDGRAVRIFSFSGSKKLSFQWVGAAGVQDFGFTYPNSVELYDVKRGQEKFPTVVEYGFLAVIPSNILKDALTNLLQSRRKPSSAETTLVAPRVDIMLTNEITLSTEDEAARHKVWFGGNYWESLQKATLLADNCSMYLTTNPAEYVMLRFKLGQLGDLVYLIPGQFLTDNTLTDLPLLGNFHSLRFPR